MEIEGGTSWFKAFFLEMALLTLCGLEGRFFADLSDVIFRAIRVAVSSLEG
ncbi:MAG: hypothetical protein MI742_02510 [Desulfobacterales bacterium]|nr:hypothetical protein [Desulfobacterales bacterium]